jgi:hypothetical protein
VEEFISFGVDLDKTDPDNEAVLLITLVSVSQVYESGHSDSR